MVRLDIALVREAELLTTGATIHKTSNIVSMYKARVKDAQTNPTPQVLNSLKVLHKGLEEHVRELRKRQNWAGNSVV